MKLPYSYPRHLAPSAFSPIARGEAAVGCDGWLTVYSHALSCAASKRRIVLLDFSGIPWCQPCVLQEEEVFATQIFKDWAKATVILMRVMIKDDYSPVSPQHGPLLTVYGVSAFPTVIGLDGDGTERGRLIGYVSGVGAASWIQNFEQEVDLL